ncbi:hypothetical protein GBAR_LOCUS25474, partial [Geodia barretti]
RGTCFERESADGLVERFWYRERWGKEFYVGAEDEHVFKLLGLKELIIKMQKTSMFAISKYGISGANTD